QECVIDRVIQHNGGGGHHAGANGTYSFQRGTHDPILFELLPKADHEEDQKNAWEKNTHCSHKRAKELAPYSMLPHGQVANEGTKGKDWPWQSLGNRKAG